LLHGIKYVTTAFLYYASKKILRTLRLNGYCRYTSFVQDNFLLVIVASILMGVSNEFSSATHCSGHRRDCQSHCSVARIGPTTRAGQESAAVSPGIAATETAEWEQRYPMVSSEIDQP
jgi:hypothetical protein